MTYEHFADYHGYRLAWNLPMTSARLTPPEGQGQPVVVTSEPGKQPNAYQKVRAMVRAAVKGEMGDDVAAAAPSRNQPEPTRVEPPKPTVAAGGLSGASAATPKKPKK